MAVSFGKIPGIACSGARFLSPINLKKTPCKLGHVERFKCHAVIKLIDTPAEPNDLTMAKKI